MSTDTPIDYDAIMAEWQVQQELFARANRGLGEGALESTMRNIGIDSEGLNDFCLTYLVGNGCKQKELQRAVPAMMRGFMLGVQLGRQHHP